QYLEDLETPVGRVILRELLSLERAYRLQHGEKPTAQEYEARFPAQANLIGAVFAGATEQPTTPYPPPTDSSLVLPGIPPPSESASVPHHIGRFQVVRRLGGGTYGDVYLAHDAVMDRQVAVKVPSARLLASQRAREEFLREARNVARLQHEGIIRAY